MARYGHGYGLDTKINRYHGGYTSGYNRDTVQIPSGYGIRIRIHSGYGIKTVSEFFRIRNHQPNVFTIFGVYEMVVIHSEKRYTRIAESKNSHHMTMSPKAK